MFKIYRYFIKIYAFNSFSFCKIDEYFFKFMHVWRNPFILFKIDTCFVKT